MSTLVLFWEFPSVQDSRLLVVPRGRLLVFFNLPKKKKIAMTKNLCAVYSRLNAPRIYCKFGTEDNYL